MTAQIITLRDHRKPLDMGLPKPSGIRVVTIDGKEATRCMDPGFNRLRQSLEGITTWIKSEEQS